MKSIELKDIFLYRYLSSVTYSPKGLTKAFIVKRADEKNSDYTSDLYLIDEEGKVKQLTSSCPVSSFIYEDEETVLFSAYRSEDEKKDIKDGKIFTSFYRINLHGGEAVKAFTLPLEVNSLKELSQGRYLVSATIDLNHPDFYKLKDEDKEKVYKEYKDDKDYEVLDESPFFANGAGVINKKRTSLFIYTEKDNHLEAINDPKLDVSAFDIQGDDIYFAAEVHVFEIKGKQTVYHYSLKTRKTEAIVPPTLAIYGIEALEDGKVMVIGTEEKHYGQNENPWFYLLDPETKEMKCINEADESIGLAVLTDVELGASRFFKKVHNEVCFAATDRYYTYLKKIDESGKISIVESEKGSLMDYDVLDDEHILMMGLYKMRLPEVYEQVKGKVSKLTSLNDEFLEGRYVAEPEYLNFDSCGWNLDGWVLKPKDYDPNKKYPAVLDIHGGPKCAYGPVFFHEMQAWASLGYFVLFCNPFGGDGRGNKFADLNQKWGKDDYTTLMAFVDEVLKKYPSIDPKKVCATGGSYGGYMSNWIEVHTDRFCCIATQRSISNWITMYGVSDISPNFAFEMTPGDIYTGQGIRDLWEASPLKYVQNAKTPMLFIHSDEDHRCPIDQGYQLFTALQHRKVESRMVVFHGENHELSRSGKPLHRLRRLNEITNWFEKYAK